VDIKKYELEYINCPLCGSNQLEIYLSNVKEIYVGLDEYFDLNKCIKCGHIFTNPRPTLSTIEYFYPNEMDYYLPKDVYELSTFKQNILNNILNEVKNYSLDVTFSLPPLVSKILFYYFNYKISYDKKIPNYVNNGKLLEIGCSWGSYLLQMQKLGWDVYGVEMNTKASEYAKKILNSDNIMNNKIENIDFKSTLFDVIVLNMVLEHIYDPIKLLNIIKSILKPNGIIIINIPNIDSIEFKIFKDKSYFVQVPQHVHHFNYMTINKLLEKTGFNMISAYYNNSATDIYKSCKKNNNNFKVCKCIDNRFCSFLIKYTMKILGQIKKTSRMVIYASRNTLK